MLDFLKKFALILRKEPLEGDMERKIGGPCELYDRECIGCLECEICDLDPNKVCDNCGKCKSACPGNAIDDNGNVDNWQCAVYYSGANGKKNPFMPPDAFSKFDNRLEIIAGEAKVTPETARKILDNIYF